MNPVALLARVPRYAARSIREFGLVSGLLAGFEGVVARMIAGEDVRRDRVLGIDTATWVSPMDLGVDGEHARDGFAYVASPSRLVRAVLRDLPIDRDSVFVDLGSGKGRALLVAAEFPFGEVIGVEYSGSLNVVAAANVARVAERRRSAAPIRIVQEDAAVFDWPKRPCVAYLNNPFSERVMGPVLERIEASILAVPRPFVVIYQEARHEPASDRTGNLALLAASPILRHNRGPRLDPFARLALYPWRIERFDAAADGAPRG